MKKIDLRIELKHLYQAPVAHVVRVNVPPMNFLMIDGKGDPNTSKEYADAVAALFTVSYTIKFLVKRSALKVDYRVMPPEGLWWSDNLSAFTRGEKTKWKWTMMVMQPPFVTRDIVKKAVEEVRRKKNPAALSNLKFKRLTEGKCAQIMHVGPFSEEGPAIEKVHQFIESKGSLRGKHHEIYLSDIRKAAPVKWKTIVRQPMK